jgi:hypothetical protein
LPGPQHDLCQSACPITFALAGNAAPGVHMHCSQHVRLHPILYKGNSGRASMRRAAVTASRIANLTPLFTPMRQEVTRCNSPMRLRRRGSRVARQLPEQMSGGGWPWLQRLTDPVHVKRMSVQQPQGGVDHNMRCSPAPQRPASSGHHRCVEADQTEHLAGIVRQQGIRPSPSATGVGWQATTVAQ